MGIILSEGRSDDIATASAHATHDPVCGMLANPVSARASCVHDGVAVGFCCAGCKGRFLAEPERYVHAIDPVCGGSVERIRPGATARREGRRYWFCGEGCRERFEAEPERYAEPAPPSPVSNRAVSPSRSAGVAALAAGEASEFVAVYTCPCHPEVRSDAPSDCPECGMALEPEMPAPVRTEYVCPMHPTVVRDAPGSCPECAMELEPRAALPDDGPSPELADMRRRLAVACVLTLPVLVIAMSEMVPGLDVLRGGLGPVMVRVVAGGARDPGGAVVRMAVLRPGLDLARHAQAQHVHPGGDRHRRRMARQHGRAAVPGHAPRHVPCRRRAAALLRSRRGHRDPGHPRAGAGASRPRPDRRRDSPPAHPRPRRRAAARPRRNGARCRDRRDHGGRPAAGTTRRAGADRRHRARRCHEHRRVDDHRRADPGRANAPAIRSPAAP